MCCSCTSGPRPWCNYCYCAQPPQISKTEAAPRPDAVVRPQPVRPLVPVPALATQCFAG
jgi:hypothetical protein